MRGGSFRKRRRLRTKKAFWMDRLGIFMVGGRRARVRLISQPFFRLSFIFLCTIGAPVDEAVTIRTVAPVHPARITTKLLWRRFFPHAYRGRPDCTDCTASLLVIHSLCLLDIFSVLLILSVYAYFYIVCRCIELVKTPKSASTDTSMHAYRRIRHSRHLRTLNSRFCTSETAGHIRNSHSNDTKRSSTS
ncbi:hypothetical protein EDD85DRAFT_440828 [Armillaria nabsnona]|nr:hypothetical protein EDD85DRAFT_440828 [Armillaria nabsnona]